MSVVCLKGKLYLVSFSLLLVLTKDIHYLSKLHLFSVLLILTWDCKVRLLLCLIMCRKKTSPKGQ